MKKRSPIDKHAPIRLRTLLVEHDLSQSALRRALAQTQGKAKGKPLSSSAMSQLITGIKWPSSMTEIDVVAQVETWLRAQGVPEAAIATAWQRDDTPITTGPERQTPRPEAIPSLDLPEPEMLTTRARELFRLPRNPFIDDVTAPEDVYLSADQRYVRDSMWYAAKHGGFIAVIGESGAGKSTLRRDLEDRIRRDNEAVRVLSPRTFDKTRLSAAHICDAIIADMSSETPAQSLEAKARQIERMLRGSSRAGCSHVLVIEEAHDLNKATLKYLKRFWEMEDGYKRLLSIVLIGQPELAELLDERKNYDAREVIKRCEVAHLRPLDKHLEDYLKLKFRRVGKALEDVFDADAFDAIRERLTLRRRGDTHVESHVYPLNVQILVARAMNACVELGLGRVSREVIKGV